MPYYFILFIVIYFLQAFIVYVLIPTDQHKKQNLKLIGGDVSPCTNAQVTVLSSTEKLAQHNNEFETPIFVFYFIKR